MSKTQKGQLILASKSPRRYSLLHQAGLTFDVVPSHIDESRVVFDEPSRYVKLLARQKAMEVGRNHPHEWIIGADTIVMINGKMLGKPEDKASARKMLANLNGQTHQVYTGYCISNVDNGTVVSDAVCTRVTFKKLTIGEIEWYLNTDEPYDKAGAYAIQGLGSFLVKKINGSYANVVGLPVCEVIEHLLQLGIIQIVEHG